MTSSNNNDDSLPKKTLFNSDTPITDDEMELAKRQLNINDLSNKVAKAADEKKQRAEQELLQLEAEEKVTEKKLHAESEKKRISQITSEMVASKMRPRVYSDGSKSKENTEHTLDSAKMELELGKVTILRRKECMILDDKSICLREPGHELPKAQHTWNLFVWEIDGVEQIKYYPPPIEYYSESNFPLNCDPEWEEALRVHKELNVSSFKSIAVDKLCMLIGQLTTDGSLDEKSPYANASSYSSTSAGEALRERMRHLGLFDLDAHYAEMGEGFYYFPEGGYLSGQTLMDWAKKERRTHIENPESLLENDPRKIWAKVDVEEVDSLRENLREFNATISSEGLGAESFVKNYADMFEKTDSVLRSVEAISGLRDDLQELALVAFKAGMEYTTSRRAASDLEKSQRADKLERGGKKKGEPSSDQNKIFFSVFNEFVNDFSIKKLTPQKVKAYIEGGNNEDAFRALQSAKPTALRSAIDTYKRGNGDS